MYNREKSALCLCADRDRRTGGHNTNYYTGSSSKKKKNYMVVGRRRRKYENKHSIKKHITKNVMAFGGSSSFSSFFQYFK